MNGGATDGGGEIDLPTEEFAQAWRSGEIEQHMCRRGMHVPIDQQSTETSPSQTDRQVTGQRRLTFSGKRTRYDEDAEFGSIWISVHEHGACGVDCLGEHRMGVGLGRFASIRWERWDCPDQTSAQSR